MLFIRNYDKFSLDRSSTSIVDYYRQLLSRLNVDIANLRNDLVDLLNQVRFLRTDLINIKNEIQDILNEDKALAEQLGYTSSEFDAIQDILDAAEEELEDLESDIESTINRIDCSEVSDTCSYTDYVDCNDTIEEPINDCKYTCTHDTGCTDFYSDPTGCEECSYCTYSTIDKDDVSACSLCNYENCIVDGLCGENIEECAESCFNTACGEPPPAGCTYTQVYDPDCDQIRTNDVTCHEQSCVYNGEGTERDNSNCTFTCTHDTGCTEHSMPDYCTYTCIDGGCTYNPADCDNYCDYTQEHEDCNYNNCTFDDDHCTYSETEYCNYDENCGVDISCSEWTCGEAIEGCSDCGDCNDCGQECGEITCEGGDDYDPSCDECDI